VILNFPKEICVSGALLLTGIRLVFSGLFMSMLTWMVGGFFAKVEVYFF
jgi:hypothetical protein